MREISNITELAQALGTTVERLKRDVYKYTECGAWVEWDDTEVRIGSIVEGSPCEVYPATLTFPFSVEDWEVAVQEIEAEADALWREANLTEEEKDSIPFYTSANPWDAPGMSLKDFF